MSKSNLSELKLHIVSAVIFLAVLALGFIFPYSGLPVEAAKWTAPETPTVTSTVTPAVESENIYAGCYNHPATSNVLICCNHPAHESSATQVKNVSDVPTSAESTNTNSGIPLKCVSGNNSTLEFDRMLREYRSLKWATCD